MSQAKRKIMIRDKLNDQAYFDEYIGYQTERIEKFETLVEKVTSEKGTEDKGALNGLYALQGFYMDQIKAIYSAGLPIADISSYYQKFLSVTFLFNKALNYNLALDAFSLAKLLDIAQPEFEKLVQLVNKDDADDYIINFMIIPDISLAIKTMR
jgi:hypothetical protein